VRSWEIPDEDAARCDCGTATYEPDHDGWENTADGWWCHDCLMEGAPSWA